MKKIYSLVTLLAIGSAATAQMNVTEHMKKTAMAQGPSIQNAAGAESAGNRATLWSEDFGSGIPGTWSNVTVSGPVDWYYTTIGHEGDYPTNPINSTTNGNGWAIIDSDGDNFSGGGAEDAQLTTDVIDLTGSGDIKLEFEQMFREWQADITTVRVTTDGGNSWTDWVINDGVGQSGTPNADVVTIDITAAIAANPANVQIMLWWQGSWDYGWQVDDMSISDIPNNDLKITNAVFGNGIEYYMSKLNQVQPNTFSADIKNQGLNDQTVVNLDVDVDDGTGSVYSGQGTAVATMIPGASDSFAVATYTASAVGVYDVTYTAVSNETDDDASNDVLTAAFEVTDCFMARDNNVIDGRLSNGTDAYEYGCIYEIVATDEITQVDFYVRDDTTTPGVLAFAVIYEDDGAGGQTYIDQTADYTITSGDLNNWVSLSFGTPIPVNAGSTYFVMIGSYGGIDMLAIGRSQNASPDQTCFILDGADNTWYYTNRTPMVRAGLGNSCSLGEDELTMNGISLGQNQPNPFNGTSVVNYSLTEGSNVTFQVIDVTGKVVMEMNEGSVAAGDHNVTIDANALNTGVYFYSLTTDKHTITKQMVVTK
jgi:hypothetical protein